MFVIVPKGFIPDQDTDQIAGHTEAAQGTSYDQMVEYQRAGRRCRPQRPERRSADVERRRQRGGDARRTELRTARRAPQAARTSGTELVDRDHRGAAAAAGGDPRHASLPAESADRPDRRPGDQEPVPVLDAVARQARSCTTRRASCEKRWRTSRACEDVTSDVAVITARRSTCTIDRDKAAALRCQRQPDRERALRRLRPALGLDDLRARSTSTKCCWSWSREYPGRSAALSLLYFKRSRADSGARPDPARSPLVPPIRCAHRRSGPQTINHYGQLPAATISFDLQPGASLGERGHARFRKWPTATLPDDDQHPVPGRGQGVPELARQPVGAARSSRSWWSTSCSGFCTRATSTR